MDKPFSDKNERSAPNLSLPSFKKFKNKEGHLCVTIGGTWRSLLLEIPEQKILSLFASFDPKLPHTPPLILTFANNFFADTAGALLLAETINKLSKRGYIIQGVIPEIIQRYIAKEIPILLKPKEPNLLSAFLLATGKATLYIKQTFLSILAFFGETVITLFNPPNQKTQKLSPRPQSLQTKLHQSSIRWVSFAHHIEVTGIQAIPIIALISFLIGAVLAYQGIQQLSRFGASIYTVDFLAISLLREISVLLTSIVIAGRSGSAFTAQIGTMGLNEEIDAIRMLGLNPFQVLVIPRMLALLVSLPLLVLISDIMGAIGGMVITNLIIDLNYFQYWDMFQKAVSNSTFWAGMSKAPLFALIISVIGCYRGFQVKGSAESVGLMTTQSVVESIFLVIVSDGLVSILYSWLDI